MEQLKNYINNPTAQHSFLLGYRYEQDNVLAAAIEFYLEAAESNDEDLSYESLLRASICYQALGSRESTVEKLLLNALSLKPQAAEGYFLLSRFYEWRKEHHKAYMYAKIGLEHPSTCHKSINGFSDYAMEFQVAVSAWWIGKTEEARKYMYSIYCNSDNFKELAFNNLRSIGYPRDLNAFTKFKSKNLKIPFIGSLVVDRNYSQIGQDLFVLCALKGLRNGKYIEIGSGNPIKFNNTYLLEKSFGWTGISLDIDAYSVFEFKLKRDNEVVCADATTYDYSNFKDVDYLQVDCEPPAVSFQALQKVLNDGVMPKVITFEHDGYIAGDEIKLASRELLTRYGYKLVVADVKFDNKESAFEDWWVLSSISNHLPTASNILGMDYLVKK